MLAAEGNARRLLRAMTEHHSEVVDLGVLGAELGLSGDAIEAADGYLLAHDYVRGTPKPRLRYATARGLQLLEQVELSMREVAIHYRPDEYLTIAPFVRDLSELEFSTVRAVLAALEADRVRESEIRDLVAGVSKLLEALERREARHLDDPAVSALLAASTQSLKHKLKLTIPIIPLLLRTETELELGIGANLGVVWQQLRARLLGE